MTGDDGLPEALACGCVLVPLSRTATFRAKRAAGSGTPSPAGRRAEAPGNAEPRRSCPVLWDRMGPDSVPQAARTVAIEYGGLDSYAELGLYGIMKLARCRADYDEVVRGVARRVGRHGQAVSGGAVAAWSISTPAGPVRPPGGAPRPGIARLLITVAAPCSGRPSSWS